MDRTADHHRSDVRRVLLDAAGLGATTMGFIRGNPCCVAVGDSELLDEHLLVRFRGCSRWSIGAGSMAAIAPKNIPAHGDRSGRRTRNPGEQPPLLGIDFLDPDCGCDAGSADKTRRCVTQARFHSHAFADRHCTGHRRSCNGLLLLDRYRLSFSDGLSGESCSVRDGSVLHLATAPARAALSACSDSRLLSPGAFGVSEQSNPPRIFRTGRGQIGSLVGVLPGAAANDSAACTAMGYPRPQDALAVAAAGGDGCRVVGTGLDDASLLRTRSRSALHSPGSGNASPLAMATR